MRRRLALALLALIPAGLAGALALRRHEAASSVRPNLRSMGSEVAAALEALEGYGKVAHCQASLEDRGCSLDGPCEYFVRTVPRLARLAHEAPKVLPFLDHADARVARRALDLLCHIQDEPSQQAIARFVAQYPCLEWAKRALQGAGIQAAKLPASRARKLSDPEQQRACQRDDNAPSLEPLRPFDTDRARLSAWATEDSRALAARMSNGDGSAFVEAAEALFAMDRARARRALAAMAEIDSPRGWLDLFTLHESFQAELDFEGRRFVRARPNPAYYWGFAKGAGGAALDRVAAKLGLRPGDAILSIAAEAPEDDVRVLILGVAPLVDANFYSIATASLSKGVPRRGLAAALERYLFEADVSRGSSPDASQVQAILALFRANDRARLLEIVHDAARRSGIRRSAGYHLAKLGAAEGLDAFEDPSEAQPEEIAGIVEGLVELSKLANEAVRSRAEKLLPRWRRVDRAPSREEIQRAAKALSGG